MEDHRGFKIERPVRSSYLLDNLKSHPAALTRMS